MGLFSKKNSSEKPRFEADDGVAVGEVLNASGHKQELERQFSLLSICSIGITTGNVWAALGGSIVCYSSCQWYSLHSEHFECPYAIEVNSHLDRSLLFTMVAPQASYMPSLPYHAFIL